MADEEAKFKSVREAEIWLEMYNSALRGGMFISDATRAADFGVARYVKRCEVLCDV